MIFCHWQILDLLDWRRPRAVLATNRMSTMTNNSSRSPGSNPSSNDNCLVWRDRVYSHYVTHKTVGTLLILTNYDIIMNGVSTVRVCSSMTARSKWLSWAPPNFISNLETEYAPDDTYSLLTVASLYCLAFRIGFSGRSCYGTARNQDNNG